MLTTYLVTTEKDIKTHAYEYVVKAKKLKTWLLMTLAHDLYLNEMMTISK